MSDGAALAWETREPDRTRDLLAAVGFRPRPGHRMAVPALALAIVPAGGLDRLRPDHLRPDPGGRQADGSEEEPTSTRLLAIGVAAVDLERPGATFPPRSQLSRPTICWARAPPRPERPR